VTHLAGHGKTIANVAKLAIISARQVQIAIR
jgi:hypothetical protein